MTGSAGFDDSGRGASGSGSVEVLFVSSGSTDVATGNEPGSGTETGNSAETDAASGGATSSEGVRKPSFEGSASSGDETRRLESVGDSSGFTMTGDS
jgi:hypothetical protein